MSGDLAQAPGPYELHVEAVADQSGFPRYRRPGT